MNSQLQQSLFNGDQFIKETLFRVENAPISLLWLLKLALSFLIIVILSTVLKRLLKRRFLRHTGMSQGNRETISTLLSYGAASLGFVLVLHASGLSLAPLTVTIGGLSIGVGLGLQEFAKNLISGLTLLFEGKLQLSVTEQHPQFTAWVQARLKKLFSARRSPIA